MMGSPVGLAVFDLSDRSGAGHAAHELAGRLAVHGFEPRLAGHKLPPGDLTGADGRLLDVDKVSAWPMPESLRLSSFDKNARAYLAKRQVLLTHGFGDLTEQDVLTVTRLERAQVRREPGSPPASPAVEALRKAQFSVQGARVFIAPSEQAKKDLVELYGVSAALVRVIPPGVDGRRFSPTIRGQSRFTLFRASGWTEHMKVVLALMPEDPARRNFPLLASAVVHLADRCPAALCVVGNVPSNLPAVEKLSKMGRFFHVPATQHLENYFAAADVYVLPAVYDPFGRTVLESLSAGTPAVVGPDLGVNELLKPGEDSERVASLQDPAVLAAAIEKAWAIPREACRKSAEAHGWDEHAKKIAQIYRELI